MTTALHVSTPAGTVDENNPWPGLESFREEDKRYFRGRDAESDDLLRLVLRERLTVLYGLSGLGKSSLFQAGLFPRAREHLLLPVYVRLRHDDDAPELRVQVLDRLAAEAAVHGIEAPPYNPAETLWEHFHRPDNAYWRSDNRPVVPLLAFDQFEEVFTLGASPGREARTAAFLDELGDLIEGRPSEELKARIDAGGAGRAPYTFNRHAYKVLLGIRQDFLAALERLKKSIPSIMSNRTEIAPLRGDAALLVTEAGGPRLVPLTGANGQPGVGERIVRLVAGERGANASMALRDLTIDPALLSLFCRELNERRKALPKDSITPDLVEGNRDEILSEFYDRATRDLAPAVRRFIEDRLIITEGERTFRNSEPRAAAIAAGVSDGAIRALVSGRLIRVVDTVGQLPRLELTHDVLTTMVSRSRDRRYASEEAERNARAERERADERHRQAEARAREDQARAAQLQREASAARRFNRVVAASAVLLLGVAVYAVAKATEAERERAQAELARAEAESARADAVVEKTNAQSETARAEEATAKAEALAGTLGQTVKSMEAAQASVRLKEREAIVGAEVADQFLRMSGKLITRRAAEDSALKVTVKQDIAQAVSIRNEARQLTDSVRRAVADSLKDVVGPAQRQLEIFRGVLCDASPGAVPAADMPAVRRVVAAIQRQLRDNKLEEGLRCTTAPPEPVDHGTPRAP